MCVVEQLQTRVDQLTKQNNDHRRRASLSRRQAQQLIEDKADLQALLHDRDQEICHVRDRLKRYSRDAAVDALTAKVLLLLASCRSERPLLHCCCHIPDYNNDRLTAFDPGQSG